MFFTLSKIIGAVIAPLNLVFLLLATGLTLSLFFKRAGRGLAFLGMLLFVCFGVLPLGHNLLVTLEAKTHKPVQLPDHIDGILVLGGSFLTEITAARETPSVNETAERIFSGMELSRRYPGSILVFSGGNGKLFGGATTEAEATELFLMQQEFHLDNVFFEDESRNTYENIFFSRDLMLPQPGENWVLITSAYHMPRALAVAKAAGWGDIIPWPVDYRTDGKTYWRPRTFDLLGNFLDLQVASHEYIGFFAYQMSGKISL